MSKDLVVFFRKELTYTSTSEAKSVQLIIVAVKPVERLIRNRHAYSASIEQQKNQIVLIILDDLFMETSFTVSAPNSAYSASNSAYHRFCNKKPSDQYDHSSKYSSKCWTTDESSCQSIVLQVENIFGYARILWKRWADMPPQELLTPLWSLLSFYGYLIFLLTLLRERRAMREAFWLALCV